MSCFCISGFYTHNCSCLIFVACSYAVPLTVQLVDPTLLFVFHTLFQTHNLKTYFFVLHTFGHDAMLMGLFVLFSMNLSLVSPWYIKQVKRSKNNCTCAPRAYDEIVWQRSRYVYIDRYISTMVLKGCLYLRSSPK